ncbi:putative methyltransferase [Corynebacterium kalinowskii]|uniref:Methyltransferase n=1 Tax=Corynebacterium kalinowskii TaxID=2675216 RepID=A0A6B8V7M0_9CORY|nr:putative methyltransferase [Corynebacterium kalinowskii]
MPKLNHARRLATLGRSLRLLSSFPTEQTAPNRFYSDLAADTYAQLDALSRDIRGVELAGSRVLDVGGGPGYFADAFANTDYVSVEPSAVELHAAGLPHVSSVRADGQCLPFAADSFDMVYSSNVAEHVPEPWTMGSEMLRVTRPGGLVVLSYTVWLGPFGGHETGLWQHYVSGAWARDRYTRTHGHPPKNVFGESLFDVSCAEGIRWARSLPGATCVGLFPRYHPRWVWWLVHIPVLREFLVSNLVIVLQKD